MVKCLVFEIRTCFPVLAPKSGKQDVQTGPGQGRHLPSLLDEKIARPLPGLTTVSLRDRFWRFQPNRSSPPRVSSAILFAKVPELDPPPPPPPMTDVECGTTPFRDLLVPSVLDRSRQMNRGVRRKFCRSYLRCCGRSILSLGEASSRSSRTWLTTSHDT